MLLSKMQTDFANARQQDADRRRMADRGQHHMATLGRAYGAEKGHDGTVIAFVGPRRCQQERRHLP
jgi:hypothetical protein